ncbi:MAG: acyl--CoA ligase [Gammaproteobacteria bacterium]|jgi:acyl-CoA synthetase (AMP-forming)/AMP-acid ligase II|nr:acyl--CoA ligase [Gammaproteobacteria bacterium]MBP6050430.1 acyl--CoA ligase [Pseudomonadales bacterium]MBK6583651.1 acyl--CoA ligase [Gammaproteobacteria bacterium]MBK7169843.1 acyl--CoA ligase [Gammaproteobacteria bacterium]MBK7521990.1 acyl--CoA ligase [Gammaproteobacteria bacterium]
MQTAAPERIALFRKLGWWGDTTTWQLFEAAVEADPEGLALLDPPNRESFTSGAPLRLSWSELRQRALGFAASLREEGIARDDIVLMQLPNSVESIVAYLSCAALGAILSPVPMQYAGHELGVIARKLRPRVYLGTANFKGEDLAARHAALFDAGTRVLALGPQGILPLAPGAVAPPVAVVSADDVFTICWTSGTTGTPKGVPRSHNQWLAQTLAVTETGVEPGMTMLCPFPMVNMASLSGFFFPWLRCRGTLALHHPLDLPVFLGQIEAERVAYTIAPPALLNMLLKQRELMERFDLSSLRLVASGSAPLAPWMVREFQQEFGITVVNVFGSNEGMSLASSGLDVPDPERRATLFPRFGVEGIEWSNSISDRMRTRLVDPHSDTPITEPGQAGEMQIWGPNVIDGYFDAPEANEEVFSTDGFFRTGDMFEIAGSGEDSRYYRFVGRCKDIIVRGGMKISPDEIDTLLAGHPLLAEAAVCAYPDEMLGERICVVAVPKPGASVALQDIVGFLEERQLARIKLPEKLVLAEALPRNPLGKLVRPALRELVAP